MSKEYILKQTKKIEGLKKDIAKIDSILNDKNGIKKVIIKELLLLDKKYPSERKARLIPKEAIEKKKLESPKKKEEAFFLLDERGYIKKASSGIPINEGNELLVFTDQRNFYKVQTVNIPSKEIYIGSLAELSPQHSPHLSHKD